MKANIIIAVLLTTISLFASGQNYTSNGNGSWTTASNWNNTDNWGTSTPPTSGGHGSGTITMNHNLAIATDYNTGSAVLNIAAGKSLTVNGNMIVGGGSTVNVTGNLVITGDLTLNGYLNIKQGSTVTVNGNLVVNSADYLNVGTSANPEPYANLIVKKDLKQQTSGDVTLNKNARVAVFGNVTDGSGGGTFLKLNHGAQMYVDGNINYTGGSNITNSNSTNPWGFYVNKTISNTGDGASTTSNNANKATMQATNPVFAAWVNSLGVMPVSLLFFKAGDVTENTIVLEWATASEENFDYFIVEASSNGFDFIEIGRVTGNGTTKDRHDYTFDVVNPAVGKTYFRLKSVDFDGYTETFKMISVTYESAKSVKIYPNPVVDSKMSVEFNFIPGEEVLVAITNLNGIEIARQTINAMQNLLPLSLEAGFYLVKIQSHEINSVIRIQVL